MMIEMMEMLMMVLKNWHPLFASQTPRFSPRRSSASCGGSWGQKIIISYVAFSHLYKSQELGTSTPGASPPFCFPVASWMLGLPGSPQGSPHPHLRILSKAQQSRELSAFAEETSSTTRCGKCQINLPKKIPKNYKKMTTILPLPLQVIEEEPPFEDPMLSILWNHNSSASHANPVSNVRVTVWVTYNAGQWSDSGLTNKNVLYLEQDFQIFCFLLFWGHDHYHLCRYQGCSFLLPAIPGQSQPTTKNTLSGKSKVKFCFIDLCICVKEESVKA